MVSRKFMVKGWFRIKTELHLPGQMWFMPN